MALSFLIAGCGSEEAEQYCDNANCRIDAPMDEDTTLLIYTTYSYQACCKCMDGRTGNSCGTAMYDVFFKRDYIVTNVANVDLVGIYRTTDLTFEVRVNINGQGVNFVGTLMKAADVPSSYEAGGILYAQTYYFVKDEYFPVITIAPQTSSNRPEYSITDVSHIGITDSQYHIYQKTGVGENQNPTEPTSATFSILVAHTDGSTYDLIGEYTRIQ
jgi:hypothetical protein